ncbi:MAG TPA: serine/threonine-protein kinase, partial [Polyangiaceae bacterium]
MTSDDDAKRGPRGTLRLTPKPRTERLSAGDTAARSRASKSGTRDDRARRADPRRTPAPEDAARDPRGPVLLPGIRVGDRFEIVELTDEGATARIYKADQVTMGRTVALKMVHVRDAPARARKRVRDEIRALIRLDHPNVVRIIDAGQWDDWIYVVEEWLRGTTLRRFMLERGRIPRKEALELAVQMLAGLGAAHAAKIVHRDLKPENVFVTETGAVKLLDFGLAKSMDASGSSSRGLLVGTPGYMAPERLMPLPERVKNDPRADLFSFGVILYEMLAGAHPYKFGRKRLSAEQLALYMASFDPPVLAAEPLELWKLIARTISRYPDERPASADIIVRELRRILAVPALPVAPPARSGRSQLVAAVARS